MSKLSNRTALVAAAASLLATHANAEICWISSVKAAGDGVNVWFQGSRAVNIRANNGDSRTFVVDDNMPEEPASGSIPAHVHFVAAKLGDRLFSFNTPEDVCSMTIVSRDGKLAIEAHASFHPNMPGAPVPMGSDVTRLIFAD